MRNGWLALCRRLAPESLRERVFDPAAHDLAHDHAIGTRGRRARLSFALFALALECRRLDAAARWQPASLHAAKESLVMTWFRDVRRSLRQLARQPMLCLIAVLTLALGIGANVAVFSFVNAYVIARLPVPASEDLVRVYGRTGKFSYDVMSYPTYRDARDGAPALDLAAHISTRVLVGGEASSEARTLELVSGNYFRVLRLAPVLGRLVGTEDDGAEGAHPVVVLGEAYWRARFGAAPNVVGQTVRLNGSPFEIVGVAPEAFQGVSGASAVDLWAPITMQQTLRPRQRSNTLENRNWGWLQSIGRLPPGSSVVEAQHMLDRVAGDINRRFPSKKDEGLAFVASPAIVLAESDRQALLPFVRLTFVLTSLLLLVTCANLAGLMQSRVAARRREIAIRQSLGAGRSRLVSEWLAECAVLAGAGGLSGLLVSRLAVLAMIRYKPPSSLIGSLSLSAPLDGRVLAFAAAVSVASAVVFGLWPALRASVAQPVALLKEEGATSTGGRRGGRTRRAAVLVQVAASAALLVASGLLATSLHNLRAYDAGFDTGRLAIVSVDLNRPRLADAEAEAFRTAALARVRALPGVSSADVVAYLPLAPGSDRVGFRIPGHTESDGSPNVSIDDNIVGAGYFSTLGLTFLGGGPWAASGAAPGVVVNETMAKRFWPAKNAVGQPIELIGVGMLAVSGVVRDSAYYQVGERPLPYVFLPAEAAKPKTYVVIARTAQSPEAILPDLVRAIAGIDPRVTPFDATTFETARQAPLYPRALLASTAAVFGAVAMLLTGVGLYGVISTSVARRTREIGVRMALGARAADLQRGVLRESLSLAGVGVGIGLAGGYLLAGALGSWLFGVAAFDLPLYLGVAVVIALLAVVAGWAPARRASKVDPVVALRAE